jgi:hypothetical protein
VLLPSGGRRSRPDTTLALAFLGGALAGALALVPAVLIGQGLVSPVPAPLRIAVWAVAAVTIVAINVATGKCPLPQVRHQIDQAAIAARRPGGAFHFGAALGTGLLTYLPSCAPHLLLLSLVLLAPNVLATSAGALGFGLGRALGLVGRAMSNDRARYEHSFQRAVDAFRRGGASIAVLLLVVVTVRM